MILSIDPGLNHVGVALWSDAGTLLRAWLARSKLKPGDNIADRWRDVVRATGTGRIELLIVEGQQIYRGGQRGANPNDLLELSAVLGALAMAFPDAEVKRILPKDWTHGAKHEVINNRVWQVLSFEEHNRVELKPKSLSHNVVDAVAIGLFAFGRLWKSGT